MKAKIKDTNEIINVKFAVHPNPAVEETYWWCQDKQESYHKWELDFLEVNTSEELINWEQRRYEIAKEVVAAYSTFEDFIFNRSEEELARWSIRLADALIEELKKSKNEKL